MANPAPPATITAEYLCGITGLTDRRHRQLAKAGFFPPPINGRYQGAAALVGIIRYQRQQLEKKSDSLRQEQEAYTRAKRELAQEELAQFRGRYVEVAELGPALRNVGCNQRQVLQQKLEQELAPTLAGLTTQEILLRIQKAVDEILAVFREGTKRWAEKPPEPPDRKPGAS
jgi:hypothetical protein